MGKERRMPKMLKTHQNTIGNLMITLLFVGGCIFLLTGSWDASETEAATGCCGGGEATLVAETTGGCCGGTNKASGSGNHKGPSCTYTCNCLDTNNENADCGHCSESSNCGGDTDMEICSDTEPNNCAGQKCGPSPDGNKCNEDDFATICSKDNDRYGCSGDNDGCSKD